MPRHKEAHLIDRIGWLRASVLGANDGIVSTASLIVGVAAASTSRNEILVAGVAGLVAGAMSMATRARVRLLHQLFGCRRARHFSLPWPSHIPFPKPL